MGQLKCPQEGGGPNSSCVDSEGIVQGVWLIQITAGMANTIAMC